MLMLLEEYLGHCHLWLYKLSQYYKEEICKFQSETGKDSGDRSLSLRQEKMSAANYALTLYSVAVERVSTILYACVYLRLLTCSSCGCQDPALQNLVSRLCKTCGRLQVSPMADTWSCFYWLSEFLYRTAQIPVHTPVQGLTKNNTVLCMCTKYFALTYLLTMVPVATVFLD